MKSKLPLCKVLLVRYPVMKELLVIPKLTRLFAGSWEGTRARCITTIKVYTYQLVPNPLSCDYLHGHSAGDEVPHTTTRVRIKEASVGGIGTVVELCSARGRIDMATPCVCQCSACVQCVSKIVSRTMTLCTHIHVGLYATL